MSAIHVKEVSALRTLIDDFINTRLQDRLAKLRDDDPKRDALRDQFERETWLKDAARRVAQIQVVTHSLKAIHPDAKGTNLFVEPSRLPDTALVGSHCLAEDYQGDAVGNAAALDVYKFLQLELDGQTLLDRALANDPALPDALSDDPDKGKEWMHAFAGITRQRAELASHSNAKQIYWLVDDDPADDQAFHLLAPLYPTSLVQEVHQRVSDVRFGEATKAARQARRNRKPHDTGYRDYPNLAIQKLGGTKPQNISQLNSMRGGNNYLFASVPPTWQSREVRPPYRTDSVFPRFGRRNEVKTLVNELKSFLESKPAANRDTRDQRDELTQAIIDELLHYAAQLCELEAGWSATPECELVDCEQLWLDPHRAESDEAFRLRRQTTDWPTEVRTRFAQWLDDALQGRLSMADPEHRHWSGEWADHPTWTQQLDADRRWLETLNRELDDLEEEVAQ